MNRPRFVSAAIRHLSGGILVGRAWLRRLAADQRLPILISLQLVLAVASNYVAFWLRFDGDIPAAHRLIFAETIGWLLLFRAMAFVPFGLYSSLWQYTGVSEVCNIVAAVGSSTLAAYLIFQTVYRLGYSRSILVIDALLLVTGLCGARLLTRVPRLLTRRKGQKRIIIYGAGDAGEMLVRDMRGGPHGYEPLGFVDDDPAKFGQRIHGVPVLGSRTLLARILESTAPHEVLVAMPSAAPSTIQALVQLLQPYKIPITTLPSVRDILGGRVAVNQIRQLTITDLLPRAAIDLDREAVRRIIQDRCVLVTGAGGSIGAELARQIAELRPAVLVLYERYENALHDLTNELTDRFGPGCVRAVVGDVTDARRIEQVMVQYPPHVVFHAAAHKHVPLMEHNPCEAVKNNVVGTLAVAEAADRCRVERFILISTDKAVNPSSIMGATKRVCELIVQMMSVRSPTRFAAVRFGNVLGSNGSVLLRFVAQIKAGGPVTVTHPEMRRFFMLIPEAVQLVLHAGALGESSMTYVLDMGEQIKLVDLARNVIRLAGFIPENEIPIHFIGLRPGEKLFEELIASDETPEPTAVPRVVRLRGGPTIDPAVLRAQLSDLVSQAVQGDADAMIGQLRRMVPTFEPAGLGGAAAATLPTDALVAGMRGLRATGPQPLA